MRDDRERIQDILDAISHIEKYAIKGRKTEGLGDNRERHTCIEAAAFRDF